MVLNDLPTVRDLPAEWWEKWSPVAGTDLPRVLQDPNPGHAEIPNREEIAQRNRQVVLRLLESARPYWF